MEDALSDAAAELSKAGASKGGKARTASMTPEERKELASNAGKARWAKAKASSSMQVAEALTAKGLIPVARHRGNLNLVGIEIPCYVLGDGRRVIGRTASTEMLTGIKGGGDLEKYLGVSSLKPFIDIDLVLEGMVSFSLPEVEGLGREVKGLPADLLIEVCRGFVAALQASQLPHTATKLTARQTEMALKASMFLAACAKLGLEALIDEATGYQFERAENALQVKLAAYLDEEMRPWEKTFPDELWQMFGRLTGWKGSLSKRPKYWGRLVMELIYDYLDKDVATWLRENAPQPRYGQNYHQYLSSNFGLKKLLEHIWKVIGVGGTCENIAELKRKLAEIHGRQSVQFTLYMPPEG